jgi:hypothetical protein
MKRSERSGFTRCKSAPLCLPTGTDREVLAVWVVACVEHVRAAAGVVKIKDGIVNLQGVHHDPQSRRTRLPHPRCWPRSA